MELHVPVIVTHVPTGQQVATVVEIDAADLDWFPDGEGGTAFDADQAEDIAHEAVMDDLAFTFGTAAWFGEVTA